MNVQPMPPVLAKLIELRPPLRRRVEAMFNGCLRNGRTAPDAAADWVLKTLRREAEARAAEGGGHRPIEYRNDRQYAREMRARENRLDNEFLDALATIGAIDRARLESGSIHQPGA